MWDEKRARTSQKKWKYSDQFRICGEGNVGLADNDPRIGPLARRQQAL
jgi:hypothetical protein